MFDDTCTNSIRSRKSKKDGNTMTKRNKRTVPKTMIYKTLHSKLMLDDERYTKKHSLDHPKMVTLKLVRK
jgi:hypothetical protein